ncbi:MAG: hypothetical protein KDD61_16480, partial [Bdellovibrionales bacterium]|nr:hypothetical protein [Bdellovibrionales bacterium]
MSSKFEMSVHTLKNKTSLLKESAENQSAALTETSSALTEISGMVDQNVRYAERALEESTQSQSHVNHGKDLVEKMLTTMLEISESSQKMAQQTETNNRELEKIVSVINEITEKTHIIHDIVFQTKLLSFNASVEAARAGEHGKGFSVVAEEIGNLAEMSGKAAKEISNLLNMSSSTVHEIVKANQVKISGLMHSNSEKVKSGGECA